MNAVQKAWGNTGATDIRYIGARPRMCNPGFHFGSFLRGMVRRMVAVLLEVGQGTMNEDDVRAALAGLNAVGQDRLHLLEEWGEMLHELRIRGRSKRQRLTDDDLVERLVLAEHGDVGRRPRPEPLPDPRDYAFVVSLGHDAAALHGDIPQRRRERVLEGFRKGTVATLVATNLAARGLHVDGIDHVVNFDLPEDPETYVHRIGRTGRAGERVVEALVRMAG